MTTEARPLTVGVPKETFPGEQRVAIVPDTVKHLAKAGMNALIEAGAGYGAGFTDAQYREKGAEVVSDRLDVFVQSDIIAQVRGLGANPEKGRDDLNFLKPRHTIVSLFEPLTAKNEVKAIAMSGVRSFALELIPRITRAQNMDVLSSMATIAGYKAAMISAEKLPKMFPMMMTAAGTIKPAKVFIIGAGVAGLQCIASAKKAGAVVYAFDVRPEVKEQIESLGGKFLEIEIADARGEGGYARELTAEEKKKQQEMMATQIAESDVVITTAAVPGKKAPVLIPADVARRMHAGSVIIDMAAERGGNCELAKAGETIVENGITIIGPTNIPANLPFHASQMFAKNVQNLLSLIIKDGQLTMDMEDEIIVGTLECDGDQIVHKMAREIFGLEPLAKPEPAAEPVAEGSSA